ncbi:MAG: (Fe-S)-binding protein [Phycisphaerae bacterium]|nr:(Fe-S)-binding protein [Phycisphaerae bacterium]
MTPTIGLFIPCYVDQCFPHVARAAVRILERLGVRCDYDRRQTCCGQPAYNSGYWPEAARLAEHFVNVFDRYEQIVAPGGSCVSMIRNHYRRLLGRDEPVTQRVHELCEFLTEQMGVDDLGSALPGRAALHMSCHMLRELDGDGPVRRLLANVRGLEIVDLPSDTWCCGFGGTFAVKFPELSAAMGRRKLKHAEQERLDYLLSPEASCLMQLGGLIRRDGVAVRPLHVAEVLAGMVD